eukprot:365105-Chlamydomonas_euryale.AAC.3
MSYSVSPSWVPTTARPRESNAARTSDSSGTRLLLTMYVGSRRPTCRGRSELRGKFKNLGCFAAKNASRAPTKQLSEPPCSMAASAASCNDASCKVAC